MCMCRGMVLITGRPLKLMSFNFTVFSLGYKEKWVLSREGVGSLCVVGVCHDGCPGRLSNLSGSVTSDVVLFTPLLGIDNPYGYLTSVCVCWMVKS